MTTSSYIYILTNKQHTTLYVGVTTDLVKRIWQHKEKLVEGFTKKYNLNNLVYFEQFESIEEAIKREKQLKAGSRKKKVVLIEKLNHNWEDLYEKII